MSATKSDTNTVQQIELEGYSVVIFRDELELFRWKIVSFNTQVVGASEQGFASHAYCLKHLQRLGTILNQDLIQKAEVVVTA